MCNSVCGGRSPHGWAQLSAGETEALWGGGVADVHGAGLRACTLLLRGAIQGCPPTSGRTGWLEGGQSLQCGPSPPRNPIGQRTDHTRGHFQVLSLFFSLGSTADPHGTPLAPKASPLILCTLLFVLLRGGHAFSQVDPTIASIVEDGGRAPPRLVHASFV